MGKSIFYKSFDERLCGRNGYSFMVNQTYTTDDDDTWQWFHYSQYLSSTLIHSSHTEKIRICEVEPLGRINKFRCMSDGYNKGFYYTTDKLFIVRELVEDEVLVTVEKEKCPLWMVLKYLRPPYEWLLKHRNKIRGDVICIRLLARDDLSDDELRELLPKTKHKRIEIRSKMR